MKRATLREATKRLSELVDEVRQGETFVITDAGVPVARLIPAARAEDEADEVRLDRLERLGLIVRGRGGPPDPLLMEEPPGEGTTGVLDALLQERRESYR